MVDYDSFPAFKPSNVPTPAANIVTSICRFVNFIISAAFSVETAAAFAPLTPALSRRARGLVAFEMGWWVVM